MLSVCATQLATKHVKRNVTYKHVKSRIKELYFESEKMNEKQENTRSEVNNNIACLNMFNLISKQTNKQTTSEIFADHSSHSLTHKLISRLVSQLLH